jgi:hypothetical protein
MCHPPLNAAARAGTVWQEVGKFRAMPSDGKSTGEGTDSGLGRAPCTQGRTTYTRIA